MKRFAVFALIPLAAGAGVAGGLWWKAPAAMPSLPQVERFDIPELPAVDAPLARRQPVEFRTSVLAGPRVAVAAAPPAPVVAPPARPLPILRAVLIDGNRRLAQLDGAVVPEGATVAGFRVERIEPWRVRVSSLESGGARWIAMNKEY
jgi:hypothetical protein